MTTLHLKNISAINEIASEILNLIGENKIIAIYGELGAGKTTLIKSCCQILHAFDSVASPTFSLINEYLLPDGDKVFHFDLYRIENEEEIYDFGYAEYIYSNNYCFIEWPEKIKHLLPNNTIKIFIDVISEQERLIRIMI